MHTLTRSVVDVYIDGYTYESKRTTLTRQVLFQDVDLMLILLYFFLKKIIIIEIQNKN